MSPRLRRFVLVSLAAGLGVMALGLASYAAGLRVNTTRSIPLGVYRVASDPVGKGAYVLVCPPDEQVFAIARNRQYIAAGFCPGSYGYLMKHVSAAKGDVIDVTDAGVSVNGKLLPDSKPRAKDGAGRVMPTFRVHARRLGEGELLLMGDDNPKSFDGRYYGLVDMSHVETVIKPVLTW